MTVSYTLNGRRVRREFFASAADDVLVMRIEGSRPGALELGAHLHRKFDGRADPDGETGDFVMRGKCGALGTSFEARLRILADGGSVRSIGDHLSLSGADAATVLIAVASRLPTRGLRSRSSARDRRRRCAFLQRTARAPHR